jgi:hypothetical protein
VSTWLTRAGKVIPPGAHFFAVADTFDALTSDRPYRSGMPVEKAIAILREGAGKQWHAEIVGALLSLFAIQPDAVEVTQQRGDAISMRAARLRRHWVPIGRQFSHQAFKVQRFEHHAHTAIFIMPKGWITIPGELDAIPVRIVKVNGFVRTVIRRTTDWPACLSERPECPRQINPFRIVDRKVVETGRAAGRLLPVKALPRIQTKMVVITPGREKRRPVTVSRHHIEPEQIPIKGYSSFDIGNLEMNMADPRSSRSTVRSRFGHGQSRH